MKSCLKSVLIASAVFFAVGLFTIEDASAQGPIIRRMRERLNGGKALLPFVEDIEAASRAADKRPAPGSKKPTLATKKKPTPASKSKTPTPAKKKSGSSVTKPTPANNRLTPASKADKRNPTIKLESPGSRPASRERTASVSKGFGMSLQKQGDEFYVGQIDPNGNATAAGLRRGDLIEEIGGAPIKVIEEFDAITKAMRGGDRVEFKYSRRGKKPEKINVQFGQPEPVDEDRNAEAPGKIELQPADLEPSPTATRRRMTDRYEPPAGSGLKSIYEGTAEPASILEPTPAPTPANRVESLGELDFPALEGGK